MSVLSSEATKKYMSLVQEFEEVQASLITSKIIDRDGRNVKISALISYDAQAHIVLEFMKMKRSDRSGKE